MTITAGVATQLALSTQPSSAAQNAVAFTRQPVVQLQDVSGNAVSQAGVSVAAAIATGGGTLGGTPSISTSTAGTATFTDLKITGTIGDRTLTFSATNLSSVTSSTVTITAGVATQLALTTQPSATVVSGTAFQQQPVVQLQDVSGNAYASRGVQNRLLSVNHQFNRPTRQDGQVAVLMSVLHQPTSRRNDGFLGVNAARKVMSNLGIYKTHVTSLPLTRILMAFAVLAMVEMKAPEPKIWPTNSGKM